MPKKRARKAPATPANAPGSLGEWLGYIMPIVTEGEAWVPMWPPDAFAIGAAFLRRTGGYVDLVNGDKTRLKIFDAKKTRAIGEAWRDGLDKLYGKESEQAGKPKRLRDVTPHEIIDAWQCLKDFESTPLSSVRDHPKVTAAAIHLCTIADSACRDLGISNSEKDKAFLPIAEQVAERHGRRSYCLHIPPEKVAVLGKQHTPQRGCSIRSLTHNLSLYTPTEIQAIWPAPLARDTEDLDLFNVLLLPWPTEIAETAFKPRGSTGPHRYFDYKPEPATTPIVDRVRLALEHAANRVNRVHAVVLPELALDHSEFEAVEQLVAEKKAILVAGVRKDGCDDSKGLPSNTCVIQPYGLTNVATGKKIRERELQAARRTQFKHHRWCLDRGQILRYGLGGRLPASRNCWEYTYIGERQIHFITLTSWLTISTLICEDLARQEPVTEVLRAVGPNLIFALLMDGPQLKSRWSSRYASVLAEDPGCSVLSLTSLGMSKRSKVESAKPEDDKTNFIALWRDAIFGEHEICLDKDHDACVLSLVCQTTEEFTIDGRGDGRRARFPVFAGCLSFATPSAAPKGVS